MDIELFKRDFEDPSIIYYWHGWVSDIGNGNYQYSLEYGRLNGNLTRPKPKRFSPFSGKQKRDAKQQAEFELTSKANKKRDKEGYHGDLQTAKDNPTFLPMLAKRFKQQKKNVNYLVLRFYEFLPELHRDAGDLDLLIADRDKSKVLEFLKASNLNENEVNESIRHRVQTPE